MLFCKVVQPPPPPSIRKKKVVRKTFKSYIPVFSAASANFSICSFILGSFPSRPFIVSWNCFAISSENSSANISDMGSACSLPGGTC